MALKKFLFAPLILLPIWGYENIDEALKNGITQGDVGFVTDYLKPDYRDEDNNIQDAYYLAITMGINYRSAFYKNMRLSVGFRAAYPLWQWHKNSLWGPSNGDSTYIKRGDMSLDFDPLYRVILSDTYLEYFDGDTSIKGGRFYLENEWASNQVDGLWVRNRSLENLMLEFLWIGQYGEATPTTITAFGEPEPNHSGYFYTASKYYLKDILWAKFYMFSAYSVAFGMGSSANVEYRFSSSKLGLTLHAAGSFEFENGAKWLDKAKGIRGGDGIDFDAKFYIQSKINGIDIGLDLGYIQSGKYSGWGSLALLNNTISPLGIGNVFNQGIVDTSLFYATLSTSFDAITLSLLYGTASFVNPQIAAKHYRQNEVDFMMSFNFTNKVSAFFNVYNTHLGNQAIPTTTELQAGVRLFF
ncbi:hypothetical protein [Helicobacter pametensis]|uniref:hypothetical protein n=1 Tax=Helicobacter pametensis TaxID=95149 RepID=UPI00048475C9|nr:hypothetical protein [Helicobacter pametensis]